MLIKNTSDRNQYVPGLPVFTAGETREVDDALAHSLSLNVNFSIMEEKKAKKEPTL